MDDRPIGINGQDRPVDTRAAFGLGGVARWAEIAAHAQVAARARGAPYAGAGRVPDGPPWRAATGPRARALTRAEPSTDSFGPQAVFSVGPKER